MRIGPVSGAAVAPVPLAVVVPEPLPSPSPPSFLQPTSDAAATTLSVNSDVPSQPRRFTADLLAAARWRGPEAIARRSGACQPEWLRELRRVVLDQLGRFSRG